VVKVAAAAALAAVITAAAVALGGQLNSSGEWPVAAETMKNQKMQAPCSHGLEL
jgi:hypothetical protein